MGKNKSWSEEDIAYLQDRWGTVSIKSIANGLGRTTNAVKIKAQRINLGDARTHFDGITINQLSYALGVSYTTVLNWIEKHRFPAKEKIFAVSKKVSVVSYDDFWRWAEKNKQMIDFSKVEPLILGVEPEWVEIKRRADYAGNKKTTPWTKREDALLRYLVNSHKYTYPEISKALNRTEGAIKRRLSHLGIKARPVRLNNHVKYTQEEIDIIVEMYFEGHSLDAIAERIGKSALGVRGKLERMGYRFKNGVPVLDKSKKNRVAN